MSFVIGVDIGSSAIKAVLFDSEAKEIIRSERRDLSSRITGLPAGHFEEDANQIRVIAFEVISSLVHFAKGRIQLIEGIAFTGQMHGGLIVDVHLKPLTNFITWQDKRADEIEGRGRSYAENLRNRVGSDPTGVSIHTGFLLATLYWFVRHTAIPQNSAYILGIYDWLTSVLLGRAVTDISSAAAWGMYNPIEFAWRSELLSFAGISEKLLPEVAEPGAYLGTVHPNIATELGLELAVRIHASIGDTQAAYLGSECTANEVLLNFGTGSQSMWETDTPYATEGVDIRYLQKTRYLACAPTLAGGEAYRIAAEFFRNVVKEFSGKEISRKLATQIMDRLALESDAHGIVFDPIFSGSKFRPENERASIQNISERNFAPGPMMRALVEGMVEEVAKPYFSRKREKGHAGLVGAGHAMRHNPALRQVAEQRFGRKLRLGPYSDEAAVGAALLCLS